MKLLLTTVPGLEFIVKEEMSEAYGHLDIHFNVLTGRVFAEVKEPIARVLALRSVENIRFILEEDRTLEGAIERSLDEVRDLSKGLRTFAVHAERVTKEVGFTSLDLAREAGRILLEKLGLRVQLDAPDIVFYVEYDRGVYRFGVDITPFSTLRDRPYRKALHKSALNPIIAYAMCRLAGPARRILDPFCGSGTIVLEYLSLYPEAEGLCGDVETETALKASENAKTEGLAHIYVQDVLKPALRKGLEVDAIITNPPFGIREKAVGRLRRVYEALFMMAEELLSSKGKLVMITPRRELVQAKSLYLEREIVINEGGLASWIYVFGRG
ncbi:methyltransferase [Infirmifilum lucidum]|uniref:Methyltransferase n=1 Tax=Infirmifilum lucidum TaxID=2776706 RepID=A0A7L9FHE3_9CREN|nr:THUMP domain-containing protein [Infirmifilum lucidum]QOJ78195.1 methyltransferase [Infirmifilum lucidum]